VQSTLIDVCRLYLAVTLGYTAGYLPIGLEPIRLCTCVVQVPRGRREAVVVGTVDLTVLRVFMS
jgi:hypothetical protein